MNIQDIQKLYGVLPQGNALIKTMEEKSVRTIFLQGLLASATPMFFASIVKRWQKTLLFVLNDNDEAGYFYNDLKTIAMPDNSNEQTAEVLFFPSSYRRAVKYGQRDAGNEILRTEVLSRLSVINEEKTTSSLPLCIVTEPSALAELVVAKHKLDEHTLSISVGQTIDLTETEKTLRSYGFQQVDYVYEPGQFAVRGSILDVYSFSSELPYRIDFFGNDVDTIRTFEVETQLSKDKKEKVEIVPELATLSEEKIPFLQFLPKESVLVMKDLLYIHDTIERIYNEGFTAQALTEQLEGRTEVEQNELRKQLQANLQLVTAQQFADDALNFKRIEFGTKHTNAKAIIHFNISPQPLFHKNFELLTQSLKDYLLQGYKLYILADSEKQTARLRDIFNSKEINSEAETTSVADSIPFIPVNRTIHEGFVDNDLKVCFFTDHQIFDRFHKYSLKSDKARQGKMALTMKELQEMEPGDFLVHVDFGIGKFAGLVRVPAGESYQEMIRLVYQHNDIVDVSIHSLYKISKYRRADSGDAAPRLSVLGSGAWDRLKEKAKKRIKDIARDLIKLYAKRRHEKGYSFSPDSYMQHELEASFLYEDTPDQLKATQDLKHDMESSRPMDRLVCGDVGFGKTEVAVRAAFKAATDGKQVAVLVPTTVLAFQHYQTFKKRLKDMPVTVDYLSRARTAKQTKQVLTDLAEGKIDILVGTHKLISKNVKWKDIGLLIIDEEQKFGVSTKEKLRQLKSNIDTLTMSATPIPRTLQFSLMGARDMSIMRTPPPNRYPIQTEIATFSAEVIADAINFEMSRNGQVFFVNDRIANLPELASLIKKNVPDCRVAIGHGQMKPEELEEIIIGFMNHDYDVLLSTTIVENGIDISNANTIIINDAHKFGLSDLHQMRGRVGRSNKKAFCYLLAPPLATLNPDARRRLEALETFSDLGSGFSLAMQDLDIRGAGNLLGAEQSGFMEDLGYETYQKILNQAVTELKNDEFQDLYTEEMAEGKQLSGDDFVDDCAVESDLEMYFPDTYVPGSSERMLLYRELDNIENDVQLDAYRKRLEDRFGPIPRQGIELMQVVSLRRLGKHLGCEKLILKQSTLQMQFVSNLNSAYYKSNAFGKCIDYIAANPRRCNIKEKNGKRSMVVTNVKTVGDAVFVLREIDKG
ncbi:MAG: transcription-repair coupling factor [Prevotella pallens]|jgi:transcription-repair coupling factor|uniref:transcription-repair coupling factor n=1 Tax=Prevotella pallens TaxID=60133 RepID=UPI001CB5F33C|nr:transcription-repair coupling factor [Prevotella pallens]MBF1488206.1 transcription-repair coupling factor [Prevotella pallens]